VLASPAWSGRLLSDYEIELLTTQAELSQWQREVTVAQAVWDYAEADGSARETAAETSAALATAVAEFDGARAQLAAAVAALAAAAHDVDAVAPALASLRLQLDAARAELHDAQSSYQQNLDVLTATNGEYFRDRIAALVAELVVVDATTGEGAIGTALVAYVAAAQLHNQNVLVGEQMGAIDALLHGSGALGPSALSLEELESQSQALAAISLVPSQFGSLEAGTAVLPTALTTDSQLDPSAAATYYALQLDFSALLDSTGASPALREELARSFSAVLLAPQESARQLAAARFSVLLAQGNDAAATNLARRRLALNLLTVADSASLGWGPVVAGHDVANEFAARAGFAALRARAELWQEAAMAVGSAVAAAADDQAAAISLLGAALPSASIVADARSSSTAPALLAYLFAAGLGNVTAGQLEAIAAGRAATAQQLTALLRRAEVDGGWTEVEDALRALVASDPFVAVFLAGNDLAAGLRTTELDALRTHESRATVLAAFGDASPGLASERSRAALADVEALLVQNEMLASGGIATADAVLARPERIFAAHAFSNGQEAIAWLNLIAEQLHAIADVPPHVVETIDRLSLNVASYAVARLTLPIGRDHADVAANR
jgi:hypothetical protein